MLSKAVRAQKCNPYTLEMIWARISNIANPVIIGPMMAAT